MLRISNEEVRRRGPTHQIPSFETGDATIATVIIHVIEENATIATATIHGRDENATIANAIIHARGEVEAAHVTILEIRVGAMTNEIGTFVRRDVTNPARTQREVITDPEGRRRSVVLVHDLATESRH
jgi:hypothetical protein